MYLNYKQVSSTNYICVRPRFVISIECLDSGYNKYFNVLLKLFICTHEKNKNRFHPTIDLSLKIWKGDLVTNAHTICYTSISWTGQDDRERNRADLIFRNSILGTLWVIKYLSVKNGMCLKIGEINKLYEMSQAL